MRIGKIASRVEYRMDEIFKNLRSFVARFLFSVKFWKFVNFLIWKIPKISRIL